MTNLPDATLPQQTDSICYQSKKILWTVGIGYLTLQIFPVIPTFYLTSGMPIYFSGVENG